MEQELLEEAVVATDGYTYSKAAVEGWIKSNGTSPKTGAPMGPKLVPNYSVRKQVEAFKAGSAK